MAGGYKASCASIDIAATSLIIFCGDRTAGDNKADDADDHVAPPSFFPAVFIGDGDGDEGGCTMPMGIARWRGGKEDKCREKTNGRHHGLLNGARATLE